MVARSLTVLTLAMLVVSGFSRTIVSGFSRTQAPDAKDWIQLFNGRDLKDWTPKFAKHDLGVNVNDTFRVEEGLLKVRYDKWTSFDAEFGHIFYREPFSHYRLAAEYRFVGDQVPYAGPSLAWARRNNGLMLHSPDPKTMLKDQDFPISIASVMKSGGIQDRQAAIDVLGTMKSPQAAAALTSFVDELTAGTLAPELQLDVVAAIETSQSSALQSRLESLMKARKAESVVDAFPEAVLRGGNAMRGRQVFSQHPAAECTRCHTLGGRGTEVGPNLTRIASTLTREQIVEAMLQPNARIAPGFGTVALTLRNGDKVVGTLKEETDTHLVVTVGTPAAEQRIAKADVRERADPTSGMPPMGLILKPREIRDLVEFLGSLK